jgi:signal transduction histidine kinase
MQENLMPDNCLDAVLPAPIIGFEDKIFCRIHAELAERTEPSHSRKSDVLADMSHEIRTPMGAIIGLAQIMLSTKLDDKQMQYMTVLQSSAEVLLEMVNRVLDVSKIEWKTANPENILFDMAVLLKQIVGIMSVKAQEKGVGLTLHYETGAAKMFVGDSGHIRQIVMNLVGNAIKFTDMGEVAVSFATGRSRNEISISVADTGIGIPKDKIGIIFDRFVQADSSIGRKYGGTGLGLSISKALAENMGGTIIVDSVAGKGSTFSLRLRLPTNMSSGEGKSHYQKSVICLDTVANAINLY